LITLTPFTIADDVPTNNDVTDTSAPTTSYLRDEDHVISIAPAEHHRPITSLHAETDAFPYHFPHGTFGIDCNRPTKLGAHRYFNRRLFSKDTRFASDPQYIFWALDYCEKKTLLSSTSIAFRKSGITQTMPTITASMLTDETQRSNLIKKDLGYRFMDNLRGSPAYWERTLKDLFAMVRQLGVPTWFCSFSAADRRWTEIPIAILKQQNKPIPDTLSWTEHCRIINSNPVTACRMFDERVRLFFKHVLLAPPHPIGEIQHYMFRTEFQSRGNQYFSYPETTTPKKTT
jgi:hypothetical protein